MKLAAVVQARMSSTRFPGKVLHRVRHRPLLEYVLERVRCSRNIDHLIVSTSLDPTDALIADYCAEHKVECFRGTRDDVAGRFLATCHAYDLDAFVRVCGDSPLLDPALLDQGISTFLQAEVDLVTNCFPRTFPNGQSVEVVRMRAFRDAYGRMTAAAHFEHVTTFFYEHSGEYRIENFSNPAGDQSAFDLSVNTPDQMAIFKRIAEHGVDRQSLAEALELHREFVA